MPKVSVVIPTHNRAEFLHTALLSVLNQTYRDFEIIVIDDSSTDNTNDVIATLNNKKIRCIRHNVNKGEAEARNTGIMNTNSQYVAFLDDDDEWLPEKLEKQVNKIENSPQHTGLIYTGYLVCRYRENKLIGQWQNIPSHKGNTYDVLMKKNIIGPPSTVLIRSKCIEKTGLFDSSIAYGLDYDYWIRLSKHFDIDYVAEPMMKYCAHENRLTTDLELVAQGARDLRVKYGKQIYENNFPNVYLTLGVQLCSKGEMIKGAKALLLAIRYNPLNINNYIYFGISLLGAVNFKRAMIVKEYLRPYYQSIKARKLF